jgi:hypothetical protein
MRYPYSTHGTITVGAKALGVMARQYTKKKKSCGVATVLRSEPHRQASHPQTPLSTATTRDSPATTEQQAYTILWNLIKQLV